jgi:hypothetical protein
MKAYRVVFHNSYEGVADAERHALIATADDIVAAFQKVVAHADTLSLDGAPAILGSAVVREFIQLEEEAI